MGSQTVFGPRGVGSLLSKATTICAVLFMVTSMGLWILSAKGTKSVVKGEGPPAKEAAAVTETQKKPEQEKATAEEQKQKKQETGSDTEKKTEKKEEKK